MTILVTGATGLIGAAVVDALADAPHGAGIPPAGVDNGDEWITRPPHAWMLDPSPDHATAMGRPGRPVERWARDHLGDLR